MNVEDPTIGADDVLVFAEALVLEKPRKLVERSDTASGLLEDVRLRGVDPAKRFPRADLPMKLFESQKGAEMARVDRHDLFPGLYGLTMLVLPLQDLRLARVQRDPLGWVLGELQLLFDV